MKDRKKLILLISLAVIIVVVIAISATFAYMRSIASERAITEVNVQSCAKIKIVDYASINLTNSYAMSRNVALKTTPYTFNIESSCDSRCFKLYLATLNTNTLPDSDIHYIITDSENHLLLEGILGNQVDGSIDFTTAELYQLNNGINGTANNIYNISYNGSISHMYNNTYKLYLYIDENATLPNSTKTFHAGIAVKAFECSSNQ